MRRLVIAVDCDDTLVLTTPYFVDAYNKTHGSQATLAEAQDASADVWAASSDTVLERWADLTQTVDYKSLSPDPEKAAVLHELSKDHELHVVTARKQHEREFTQEMLDRELAGVFKSMEFVGWDGSKGEVCRRLQADILIDDSAQHLHDALDHGLPRGGAILFGDYPWNESDRANDGIIHCATWDEVRSVIESIAQGKS